MFGSDILEVAVGLVFVYLMTSLIATAAREALEGWLKDRGRSLEQGLIELFGHDVKNPALPEAPSADATAEQIKLATQTLLERFYKHPLIFSLFRGDYHPPEQREIGKTLPGGVAPTPEQRKQAALAKKTAGKLPSYIPSANFADALLEVAESYLRPETGGAPLSFDRLSAAAWAVPNPPVRRMLLLALNTAKGDMDQVRQYLQNWYDGTMDRISGWYRRYTQIIVFCVGLFLCAVLNINTVVIAHALHESTALRSAVSQIAQQCIATNGCGAAAGPATSSAAATNSGASAIAGAATSQPAAPATSPPAQGTPSPSLQDTENALRVPYVQLQALGLPIGWGGPVRTLMWNRLHPDGASGHFDWLGVLELLVGWLMTAFAIMLGAPFWFDVLNNIMVIRSTVKPTEKSPDESSKDLKTPADAGAARTPPLADHANTPPGAPAPLLSDANAGAAEIAKIDPADRPREEEVPA